MTCNMLFSTSDDPALEVLREPGADLIGLQEGSPSRFAKLPQDLGYFFHRFAKTPGNRTVDGRGDSAGVTVGNYPSDHYAIEVTYLLEN